MTSKNKKMFYSLTQKPIDPFSFYLQIGHYFYIKMQEICVVTDF